MKTRRRSACIGRVLGSNHGFRLGDDHCIHMVYLMTPSSSNYIVLNAGLLVNEDIHFQALYLRLSKVTEEIHEILSDQVVYRNARTPSIVQLCIKLSVQNPQLTAYRYPCMLT